MIFLFLSFIFSAPAFAESERLTPEQARALLVDTFAEMEKAKYGESRAGPLDQNHIRVTFAPKQGAYRPKKAGQCTTLGEGLPERMGPVRTQAGLGWCFAVVAADILSFETGRRLSHFDLGLQSFQADPAMRKLGRFKEELGEDPSVTRLWSGFVGNAIQVGIRGGLCTEEEVSSADTMAAIMRHPDFGLRPEDAEKINPGSATNEILRAFEESVGRNLDQLAVDPQGTCGSVLAAKVLVPNISTAQIISGLSTANSRREAFLWLLQQGCKRRPIRLAEEWKYVTAVPTKKKNTSKAAELLPGVDELLSQGKPVALGYDAKKFHAGAAADPAVKSAPHASIIVKREFRDGQCKYLVRDSQGPTCAGFAPPYNSEKNCDRGQFWITEQDFEKSVLDIGGMMP